MKILFVLLLFVHTNQNRGYGPTNAVVVGHYERWSQCVEQSKKIWRTSRCNVHSSEYVKED